ncbi:MAG: FAD-binding protein [Eubacteriales bacterium]
MDTIKILNHTIPIIAVNTVVVGSGAAGYNVADSLLAKGHTDVALVTDHRKAGTSRNTGSDKQTYYKLSLAGDTPDSVADLAQVLFQGRCVDGDIALCEASLSAQGFYKLVGLGVPFPQNGYGEYVGYKTDHDPSKRATSVGPYTSKIMTEALENSAIQRGIILYDNHQVIRILTNKSKSQVLGLLCLNTDPKAGCAYTLFRAKNVVFATGGPASIYADSVYPQSHFGASGLAFEAGVLGKNLTEWQYGMASVNPRWNVSGTYMQVLPKFISTDSDGKNPREFLLDFFTDIGDMQSKIFLKGYQWPFDVRKIDGGSSIIDILVYMESALQGRRIFLDFRENSQGKDVDFSSLSPEAYEYLERAGACFGVPIERLRHMNQPAVDFYLDKGVDLSTEMLEIALCAQHNNGGLSMDKWWQTNLKGFFAVGEVAGSHGVYRPGGSALNAGQVGSARATAYIAAKGKGAPVEIDQFWEETSHQVEEMLQLGQAALGADTLDAPWNHATKRMSKIGGAMRSGKAIREAIKEVSFALKHFSATVSQPSKLWRVYRLRDLLLSQLVYLTAMANYVEQGGNSRGSALYTCVDGNLPYNQLPELFRYRLEDVSVPAQIQEIQYDGNTCHCTWRDCRPIPQKDDFFETVWKGYRENGNID